jgi:hypothetical protein
MCVYRTHCVSVHYMERVSHVPDTYAIHPDRTNNTVFGFHLPEDAQTRGVTSQDLLICEVPNHTYGDTHLIQASKRFAQQLDIGSIQEQTRLMDNGFNATVDMNSLFLQSTKLVQENSYNSIINKYISYTQRGNFMAKDVVYCFKRSIISSMKLTDTERICGAMHYELAQPSLVQFEKGCENVYGNYTEWEQILKILSFDEDAMRAYLFSEESRFGDVTPTIKFVFTTLQQIGAENMSVTDALKVYLITNIKALTSLVAITAFLTDVMPATFNASDACFVFTARVADTRFSDQQYADDLAWLMLNVKVSATFEEKCLFFLDTKQTMMKWSQAEMVKQHVGRPQLRYRIGVNDMGPMEQACTGRLVDTPPGVTDVTHMSVPPNATPNAAPASYLSQLKENSLQGWIIRARVPPAISHMSKLLGYVLMSQMDFADPSNAMRAHFMKDPEVSSNMLTQRVYKPEASVIIEFLGLLTVNVTIFDELAAFRDECFTDFSYTDSKQLTPLKFLQLYISAYQKEDVWPHVWKNFCGVLSHQVLIAVANFKKKYVYAVDKVAEICMRAD